MVDQRIHCIEEHFHHVHSAATFHGPPLNEARGRSVCYTVIDRFGGCRTTVLVPLNTHGWKTDLSTEVRGLRYDRWRYGYALVVVSIGPIPSRIIWYVTPTFSLVSVRLFKCLLNVLVHVYDTIHKGITAR